MRTGQGRIDDPEEIFMPVGVRRIDLYQGEVQIVCLDKMKALA